MQENDDEKFIFYKSEYTTDYSIGSGYKTISNTNNVYYKPISGYTLIVAAVSSGHPISISFGSISIYGFGYNNIYLTYDCYVAGRNLAIFQFLFYSNKRIIDKGTINNI